jgi:hypothetical protein
MKNLMIINLTKIKKIMKKSNQIYITKTQNQKAIASPQNHSLGIWLICSIQIKTNQYLRIKLINSIKILEAHPKSKVLKYLMIWHLETISQSI